MVHILYGDLRLTTLFDAPLVLRGDSYSAGALPFLGHDLGIFSRATKELQEEQIPRTGELLIRVAHLSLPSHSGIPGVGCPNVGRSTTRYE